MSRSVYLMDGPNAGQLIRVVDAARELVILAPSPPSDFPPVGSTIKPTDRDMTKHVYKPSGKVAVTREGDTEIDRHEIWTCKGEHP